MVLLMVYSKHGEGDWEVVEDSGRVFDVLYVKAMNFQYRVRCVMRAYACLRMLNLK